MFGFKSSHEKPKPTSQNIPASAVNEADVQMKENSAKSIDELVEEFTSKQFGVKNYEFFSTENRIQKEENKDMKNFLNSKYNEVESNRKPNNDSTNTVANGVSSIAK